MVYVNEKFLIMMTYFISLKRSWKVLFESNVFGNVNWNYYHQKPETLPSNLVCQWKFLGNSGVLYIIRKVLKKVIQW